MPAKHTNTHSHTHKQKCKSEKKFGWLFREAVTSSHYSKFLPRGFLHIGNSMRRSTPSDCQTDSSTGTAATTGNQLQPQQQLTHVSFDDDSCDSNRWGKNGLDRLPTIQFSPTERNVQLRPISSFLVQSFLPFGFHLFSSYWFIRSLLRKKKIHFPFVDKFPFDSTINHQQ